MTHDRREEPEDPDSGIRSRICHDPHWSGVTRLGVAVSGGGDSMALLHLLAECAADHGVMLEAATVDHGLRAEAATEAEFVYEACQSLDIHHETLRWNGWNRQGNLQAEARAARYGLLADWARRRGLDRVALGHTQDDQAETFLMRLAREAGVDGLAAMDAVFSRNGASFWRPALALSRRELRDHLLRHGKKWCEDPSNDDDSYDRVKARKALAVLAPLGIDVGKLAGVAQNLTGAREALTLSTAAAADQISTETRGDLLFDGERLLALPWEIQRRLLGAALVWVAGTAYPPRGDALMDLAAALPRQKSRTLHGCRVTAETTLVRIAREHNAVKAARAAPGAVWDNRWRVTGPFVETHQIRALGEGVRHCPDWRNTCLPRASLMASPAVWQGETLIAAPIAGYSGGFSAEIVHPRGDFASSVLAH